MDLAHRQSYGDRTRKVLQLVTAHPEKTTEEIRQKFDIETDTILEAVNKLQQKGHIKALKEPGDRKWETTALGEIELCEMLYETRCDIMRAKQKDLPQSHLNDLRKKKELLARTIQRTQ